MPPSVSLRLNDAPRHDEFYGFVRSPFAPGADPRFLHRSRPHAAALDLLIAAVRERRPFALLTGGAGSGKTTLCLALANEVDAATITSSILEPVSSVEDLLRKVLVDVGVISSGAAGSARAADASRAQLTGTLREFLRSLRPLQATCVLIVDDADRLSHELLEQLGTLPPGVPDEPPLMTVVLAGEPRLLETLARAELQSLGERITARVALEPLTREETGAYISHRLSAAGAARVPTFEPAAVEAVHVHTGGVPRAINDLCARTLALASQLGIGTVAAEVVEEAARKADPPAEASAPSSSRAWWTRVPLWAWIVVPLAVLVVLVLTILSF